MIQTLFNLDLTSTIALSIALVVVVSALMNKYLIDKL